MFIASCLLYIASVEPLRVLVVDDEESMRLAVNRSLAGFSVSVDEISEKVMLILDEAASAEEARDKIYAETPHILLLDQKLPI